MYSSVFLILLAFSLYGVLHSFLAAQRVKLWARVAFGEVAFQRWYRLAFNAVGILTLLPILWLVATLPDRLLYVIPFPWRWLSYAVQLFGAYVLWASLRQTGAFDFLGLRQAMAEIDRAKDVDFVTAGPYAWVRHPLYLGAMLFLWLLPVMSLNLLSLNLAISLYFLIGAYFEERKLSRYFGAAYDAYKARTPMFLPWPRQAQD